MSGLKESSLLLNSERELGLGSLSAAGKEGAHLAMDGGNLAWFFEFLGEVWDFSRVMMGNSGSLSCCLSGSPVSFRVARGSSGLLLSHGKFIRAQLRIEGESQSVSRLRQEVWVTSSCDGDLRELPSHVVSGKSDSLSSCEGCLGIPLELVQGTRASSWS